MNKLTLTALFVISILLQNHICQAQCHKDDWEALKALYESTDGDNWINKTGWDMYIANQLIPPKNCDLNALFGVKTDNGRVTCIDMDGEENYGWSKPEAGGNNLMGNLPPELSKLEALSLLRLSYNKLTGNIPVELQHLKKLAILELDHNQLSGNIPAYIGKFSSLVELHLNSNLDINGSIPTEIENLVKLKELRLGENNLTGNIPEVIGSLSNLEYLGLRKNDFYGTIPKSFSKLTKLKHLTLSENDFSGNILDMILNFPHLELFQAAYNNFKGTIPASINSLTQLREFALFKNQFSGTLPSELGDLDKLTFITLGENQFEGCYPSSISNFCSFQTISNNRLMSDATEFNATWEDFCATGAGSCLPDTITQCHKDDWTALKALYEITNGDNWTNRTGWDVQIANQSSPPANCNLDSLYGIQLDDNGRVTCIDMDGIPDCYGSSNNGGNNLTGPIPPEINKLSHLTLLSLFQNNLSGNLPIELFDLDNLEFLALRGNQLSDEIPKQIGDLLKLKRLYLGVNKFTGNIPVELTNLSNLTWCDLANNELTGNIPPEIGNLSNLDALQIGFNQLTGNIPDELYDLTELRFLWLYRNKLKGTISPKIKNLKNVEQVGFYDNLITGAIPPEIGSLYNLTWLSLKNNKLTGSLPTELCNLTKLTTLEISDNNLTGCYPDSFKVFCTQLAPEEGTNFNISDGNSFDADWEDFCETGAGECSCVIVDTDGFVMLPTNYSNSVEVKVTASNGEYILKNEVVTVYDYSTCFNYNDLENCNPVSVCDGNLSANEAFWAVTKAAEFFSIFNIEVLSVNVIVNSTEEPNHSKYNIPNNVIILGAGDDLERKSMSTPDIVGHEYAHAIIKAKKNLGNYKISGALNESYADIMGELVEYYCYSNNENWVFGEQIMVNTVENNAGIRNISKPKDPNMKYQLPNTYIGEYWLHIDSACFHIDKCGVHTNSGIHSYWFYLLAFGGSGTNDDDYNYKIENGIGIEKATEIIFHNLKNYLNPVSTYEDVRAGSICTAKELFENEPNLLAATIEAWNAVGLYETNENPIEFRITNAIQTDEETKEDGVSVIPVQFDLSIDSLGQDMSADGLCFTLYKPDTYMEMYIDTVFSPLTDNTIKVEKTDGEISICIDRVDNGINKKGRKYPLIASTSSILRFKVCIISEDVPGEDLGIKPLEISGYTKVDTNEKINFKTATLPFGFDEGNGNSDPSNSLNISLKLSHKNCYNLGAIEIKVEDTNSNIIEGVAPYIYTLKNSTAGTIIISKVEENAHQFFKLEEGNYEVVVKDKINSVGSKKFSIKFVGEQTGSTCCAENLIIPPGNVSGNFNTIDTIFFSNGTYIEEGSFEICNDQ